MQTKKIRQTSFIYIYAFPYVTFYVCRFSHCLETACVYKNNRLPIFSFLPDCFVISSFCAGLSFMETVSKQQQIVPFRQEGVRRKKHLLSLLLWEQRPGRTYTRLSGRRSELQPQQQWQRWPSINSNRLACISAAHITRI